MFFSPDYLQLTSKTKCSTLMRLTNVREKDSFLCYKCSMRPPSCVRWHFNFCSVCMYWIPRLPLNYCYLAGYSPPYVGSFFLFLRCGVFYVRSSALLPPCMPLLWLVCLGLSVLVLPRAPHATFRSIPFVLPFTKVKMDLCLARTTLEIALPFHRELLITAFQLQFSAGLHGFHLHHAFLACLSECHIKRIKKVKLWHLLLSFSSYSLLSCQREIRLVDSMCSW